MSCKTRLYLAAPLFNVADRRFNEEVADLLSEWFDVFLPQRDGELMVDLVADGMPVDEAKMVVFHRDYEAIKSSDVLLLIMDGAMIDYGATFELGVAFTLGKECWGLKTDMRQLLPIGDNPMIEGAIRKKFHDLKSLIEYAADVSSSRKRSRSLAHRAD